MQNTLQTPQPLKYRLAELIATQGLTTNGQREIRREIRNRCNIQFETLSRYINMTVDERGDPLSLRHAIIIADILKCRPEDLLTPKQVNAQCAA